MFVVAELNWLINAFPDVLSSVSVLTALPAKVKMLVPRASPILNPPRVMGELSVIVRFAVISFRMLAMSPAPFGMIPPCQLAAVPVQFPALFNIHEPSAAFVLMDHTEKQERSKTETGIFAETRSFRSSGLPVALSGD